MADTEFYRDLCRPLGAVSLKPMFGGLCLFHEGVPFALVAFDTLWFKVDAENAPAFDARALPRFAYTTKTGRTSVMSYARAPEDVYDDPDVFAEWARGAIAAARRAAAEKAKTPARPRARRPKATT